MSRLEHFPHGHLPRQSNGFGTTLWGQITVTMNFSCSLVFEHIAQPTLSHAKPIETVRLRVHYMYGNGGCMITVSPCRFTASATTNVEYVKLCKSKLAQRMHWMLNATRHIVLCRQHKHVLININIEHLRLLMLLYGQ